MASKMDYQTSDKGQVTFNVNANRLHKNNVQNLYTAVGERKPSTKNDKVKGSK